MNFTGVTVLPMRFTLSAAILFVVASTAVAEETHSSRTVMPFAAWSFDPSGQESCHDAGPWMLDGDLRDGAACVANAWERHPSAVEFSPADSRARVHISPSDEARKALESLLAESFTWQMWVYDTAPAPNGTTNYALFYYADPGRFVRNSMWFYRARQDGSYRFRLSDTNGREAGVDFPALRPSGKTDRQWHHYLVSVDRSSYPASIRAFRDGVLVDEQPLREDLGSIHHQGPLVLGNNHVANAPWHGALDDVMILPMALNESQAEEAFQKGSVSKGPTPEERDAQKAEFFEAKVRPLLIDRCTGCHTGDEFSESPLAFTSRRELLRGAEFGPAVIPGKANESLLIQAVQWNHKALKMPPDEGDRLTRLEIEDLRKWVDDGAYWPPGEEGEPDETSAETMPKEHVESDHWAFQPRSRPELPEAQDADWSHTGIDRFVYAKMREQGLHPNALADRQTLLRRATIDLTGLPPTPAEVEAFLNDDSDQAYARVIDRLLDSPRYGERWGRHWLDIARYADTQGDVGDFPIPTAYLYRNWVIDALNADMPYDRFIQAQVAGDLLAEEAASDEEARGLMVATGFLALSRRFGNTKYEDQHLMIEDTIDTLGRGVLGVTIRCARCHDHKFDPILQSDYFGLYGIFESTRYPTMGASNEKSPSSLSPAVPDESKRAVLTEHYRTIERYYYQINNKGRAWLKPTLNEYKNVSKQLADANLPPEKRAQLEKRREELLLAYDGAFRELMLHGLGWINTQKNHLADNPPAESVFAVSEGSPHDSKLHLRGDPKNLGRVIPRRFPLVLDNGPDDSSPWQGSGRLELARWLTTAEHPLTSRVMVNRVWQYHFGRGLVATSSNFGIKGEEPSHPQLLDYLTNVFVEEDQWSLKSLHRRIMLSRAYQLSSQSTDQALQQDPDNVYLTRFARRRVEAEVIRDSILAISGDLDLSRGGPFPFPHWKSRSFSLNNPFKAEYESDRRSVYLMTQRLFKQPFFTLFDGPDRNQSTEKRTTSALPTQVLFLLNSPFIQKQADSFAKRIVDQCATEQEAVAFAYQSVYARAATPKEIAIVSQQVQSLAQQVRAQTDGSPEEARRSAWKAVAKTLFASNEFLHVE
ncbi:DUF1553 domain-containing protein [Bremerella sp. JC770]|uniref:DUF1553 domain-containing protein n=1 Tax=Bremerella sp. JC770 TaxID=3232137 RepID=UPI003457F789